MKKLIICTFLLLALIIPLNQVEAVNDGIYLTHTVRSGDTLWQLGQQYDVTLEAIAESNNLSVNTPIYSGQRLRVPLNSPQNVREETYIYHTINAGDVLWNIAQKYNISVRELIEVNNIENASEIYVGRRLLIPSDNEKYQPTTPEKVNLPSYYLYKIQEGDRMWTIANNFGVKISSIIRNNNLDNINDLEVNQVILIPLNQSSKSSYLSRAAARINSSYRVQRGETLAEIADYFNLAEEALRAANNLKAEDTIYTGQRLNMPLNPALFAKHQLHRVTNEGLYLPDLAFEKGISVHSLSRANYLNNINHNFSAGDTVLVPLTEDSKVVWIEYENGNPPAGTFLSNF